MLPDGARSLQKEVLPKNKKSWELGQASLSERLSI